MPRFWVRVGYTETNYVERDVLVEGADEDTAKAAAVLPENFLDEGTEGICEVQERGDFKVITRSSRPYITRVEE